MNQKDSLLNRIKNKKENQVFDRKSAKKTPKDLLDDICAFANADGGRLYIGIEDDERLTGFQIEGAHSIEDFKKLGHLFTETPIMFETKEEEIININGNKDYVLIIEIEPSRDRVIRTPKDNVYLRQNDQSVKLRYEQVKQLEYDRGQRYFEDEIVEDATLEDLDIDLIQQYKDMLDIQIVDTTQFLKSRGFVKKGHFTNSAIILFGKNPTEFLPQAKIRFRRFDGNKLLYGEEFNVIKDQEFSGPLLKLVNDIKVYVSNQLREFQRLTLTGKFELVSEYPEFAWIEGVVNALTHRDYSIRGEYTRINMYDDRIEIISPGKLPNIVTVENMKFERYSRNPRISRAMVDFGWVREANEGVNRIYTEMEKFFLKAPVFREYPYKLELVLENNILHRNARNIKKIEEILNLEFESLNNSEKTIVVFLINFENKLTTLGAMKLLDLKRNSALNLLSDMVEKKILKLERRSNNDPHQYYCIDLK